MGRVDALFEWLVDGAPGARRSEDVVERMAAELRAAGLPVDRFAVFVATLHPTVLGRAFWWEHGAPLRVFDMTIESQRSLTVVNSPVATVTATQKELRRNLSNGPGAEGWAVLQELVEAGYADYLCLPLVFLRGETHVATFATRKAGGFTDEDLDDLRRVARPLARVAEIFALHRTAANLLSTYVGRNSGERILAGRIMKGDIESLACAIWFSDLRGFTEKTARQTPRETIDMLNGVFDCQVAAIESHGGEVLKFIGDGLLAIFPISETCTPKRAAASALAAANEAFAAVDERNQENPDRAVQFGLALHVGEISYGNIGGASRLDFTAIGPAVNVAARLEGVTGKLQRPLVLSAAFAKEIDVPLDDLGELSLKGVPEKQRVYAPRSQ